MDDQYVNNLFRSAAGIAPIDALGFIIMEVIKALLAAVLFLVFLPKLEALNKA
jgi:hypothetical protein